ncbi:MAG: cytosine permease [Euryarchaeota archaeon]|nr:cytosine permease [Euryarchaeota archaeon]
MVRVPKVRAPPEWGVDPVPQAARLLRGFDFFVLWFSLGVGLLVLAAGALLTRTDIGFGLSLAEAALVIALGSIIGSVMLAAAGEIGSRFGVPSMVALRAVLGRHGSYVPTALNVLQLVGWTSFEIMVMGEAAASLLGQAQGSPANYALVAAFGGFCALLALGGPIVVVRQWLEKFAVWLVIGSSAWITYLVFTRGVAWGGLQSGAATLLLGVDLVIAMPISWWPLISDYNRFSQRPAGAFTGTTVGYALANTWFFLLGAAMIVILGTTNVISSILTLTLGVVALFLILVDETDNGFANVYSTAVSLQNFFPQIRQRTFVVLVTVVAILVGGWLTLLGGLEGAAALAYEGFLLLIGAAFVPLLGVLVSDFLVRRGAYSIGEFYERAATLRPRAFVGWAAGALVYFYLLVAPGLGWPSVTLGSSLPAFATAVAVHYALSRAGAPARVPETG